MTGPRWRTLWNAFVVFGLLTGGCSTQASPSRSPTGGASSHVTTPSNPPSPASSPLFDDPVAVAVDGRGDMWVANYSSSTLQFFRASDVAGLAGQAHPLPNVVLSDAGGPNQLAFDRGGRLWLAQWDDDAISAYTPSQLQRSGSPKPSVRISGPHLRSPTDLAFDRSGNLWVANQGTGEIVEYPAADLAHSGHPQPTVVFRQSTAAGAPPQALAFDSRGWLWATAYYDDLLVAFAPDRLIRSGTQSPNVRVTLPEGAGPIGVTVDDQDRVWVAEAGAHAVVAYPPGLKATPSLPPAITISGPDLQMPHDITFAPDGAWVPCYNDTVLRYGPDQIRATTSAPPELVLT